MPSGKDHISRLREETRRTLASYIHGFEIELQSFQNTLAASAAQMTQKLAPMRDFEIPALESIFAEIAADANRNFIRRYSEEMGSIAHFTHDMRKKETQEEILNLLLDGAHRYAPRLALFVTRNQQFFGWSSRGLAEETAQSVSQSTLSFSESPLLRDALEADGLITAADLSGEPALAHLIGDDRRGPWHAFPMKAIGRPVAVLLVLPAEERSCDLESLCVLMDVTGLCVENMALKVLQDLKRSRPPVAAPADQPPEKPVAAPTPIVGEAASREAIPEPEALPEVESAVEKTQSEPAAVETAAVEELPVELKPTEQLQAEIAAIPTTEEPEDLPVDQEPETEFEELELALPLLEPAIESGKIDSPPDPEPAIETPEPPRSTILREVQPLSEEEKLHGDAKRFARLLASEIKLYNEQRVHEGRAHRDIYVRLKRDIDRSRDMYEKRISPSVSQRVDYFHDEIIRVLGDNDPSTLGSDYPGPRVES